MITLSGRGYGAFHLLLLLLSFCLLCSLLTEVGASEDEISGRGEGGGGGGGGGGRRSRASRNNNNQVNEIQRSRSRGKKGGDSNRRKVAQIQEVVSEVLEQQLEPLNTALRLVRLDTFTENVHRQLGTLEHIQSKLLTEYGELRAALTEVSRNTLELTKQVATLDARIVALDRSVNSQPRRNYAAAEETSAYHPRAERLESDDYAQATNPSDLSEVTDAVKEAVTSINNRLQATERRFKEDLTTLENRTTEALKKSHADLDRRMAIAGLDSVLILNTLDKLANKTCPLQMQQQQQQQQSGRRTASLNLRGDTPIRQRPQRTNAEDTTAEEDQLAYFPAEEEDQVPTNGASGERVRTWLIREGGRPVTEVQTLDLGMVNRLASEIAKQMAVDDTDTNDQPRDCAAVAAAGETTSGVYTIYPASCTARFSVQVWCELEEAGGPAWTVIQRRGSTTTETPHPVVDFFRDWAEYKWGFGNLEGEYWLGNEYIHQLTQSGDYELRVDLQDWANETRFAIYKHFALGNEDHNYTLSLGDYEGTAGNSLKYHQGAPFSTRDRDNDFNPRGHCARTFHGAWWFTACHESHLNGRYHHGRHKSYGDGINWMAFRGHNYSLKFSRMMIRRTNI